MARITNEGPFATATARGSSTTATKIIGSPYTTGLSFSGADAIGYIIFPGEQIRVLGELGTISYSSHREVKPARKMGFTNPSGFAKGPRTTAGSMIFTVIHSSVLEEYQQKFFDMKKEIMIQQGISTRLGILEKDVFGYLMPDQFPPFNMVINFSNEDAQFAKLVLYSIRIVQNGQVVSVEDIKTEETIQYMCKAAVPIKRIAAPSSLPSSIQQLDADASRYLIDYDEPIDEDK